MNESKRHRLKEREFAGVHGGNVDDFVIEQ